MKFFLPISVLFFHSAIAFGNPFTCEGLDKEGCRKVIDKVASFEGFFKKDVAEFTEKVCKNNEPLGCIVQMTSMSDVKDKLSKDHFEQLKKECAEGIGYSCWGLGQAHHYGFATEESETKALEAYEKGCAAKVGLACVSKGMTEESDPKKAQKAIDSYKASCDYENALGCYLAAKVLDKDEEKAHPFLTKACDLSYGPSCGLLGLSLYLKGDKREDGIKLLKKSCALNYSLSCRELARMYREGDGVSASAEIGVEFLERACKVDDQEACFEVGKIYDSGVNNDKLTILKDIAKAITFVGKSCDIGNAEACKFLAYKLLRGDEAYSKLNSEEVLGKACLRGDEYSCRRGGEKYRQEKIFAHNEKACQEGNGEACFQNGQAVAEKFDEALKYMETSCSHNHGPGCQKVGNYYINQANESSQKSHINKALEFYRKGCELKEGSSCYDVAYVHSQTHDGKPDVGLIKNYLEKGCELKDNRSCSDLSSIKYREAYDKRYRAIASESKQKSKLKKR